MKNISTHEIYKIDIDRLVSADNKKYTVKPLTITKEEALNNGELIRIQENQLTRKIFDYFGSRTIDMSQMIINVYVQTELKTKGEKMYQELSKSGFDCNGFHYVRFASGSGQIRRNTITFIRDDLYKDITDSLLCGLSFADFGDDFNAAKYNAYFGLNMSGCHLLPVSLAPRVCIVDDMEIIRPHDKVNYVTEREVDYITLPEEDYILSADDPDFMIMNGKAIRKSDGVVFTIRHGIHKDITVAHYDEIENSPCLNSFDGQGLMCPEWAMKVSEYLEFGYCASEMIIRAPWVKGLLATIDFHSWFAENGITEITDSFGKVRNVKDIDVIISKSQFKMHKVYKAKCADIGVNAWDYHVDQMNANNLRWGVVKPDKPDDYEKALNYQYLEALDLQNDDVEKLCQRTIDFFKKLNSGDIKEVYRNLIGNTNPYEDADTDDENENEIGFTSNAPRFQKALEANPDLINDKYIRSLILQECENKLNAAKLGKIIVRGNYQFCVSDPIAQLQWIAKNHCGSDMDVIGVIPSGCIYSNYWMNAEDNNGIVTLLRSPLIDRNEIAKRKVIDANERYFKYMRSGLVLSIHDLTALGCGGCDFDGDILFSSNDVLISKGSYDYGVARPLYYELGATGIVGAINNENVTQADIRGLNSKVGQISNKAASLYAMLKNYSYDTADYNKIYRSIIALGQIVGMEIDRIKTGVKPTLPLEWEPLQGVTKEFIQYAVEKYCKENKVKKKDFAEMIGVAPAKLSHWLAGRTKFPVSISEKIKAILNEEDWLQKLKKNNPEDFKEIITPEPEEKGIYRHNDFAPDIKPYFLKYNYQYLDKDIRHLRSVYNKTSKTNFWLTIEELKKVCEDAEEIVYPIQKCTPSLRMRELYNDYLKIYPVNNSDCIVNHIAHLFEDLDFKLHKQISKEGRNMLVDMVSEKPTDKETFEKVKNVFYLYKRFLKSETVERITNKKDGNKEIIKSFSDRLCAIRKHCHDVILDICGTCQSSFDHLVYLDVENEKYVWDLLGDDILKIVG